MGTILLYYAFVSLFPLFPVWSVYLISVITLNSTCFNTMAWLFHVAVLMMLYSF